MFRFNSPVLSRVVDGKECRNSTRSHHREND
jgi:hypothetical protein